MSQDRAVQAHPELFRVPLASEFDIFPIRGTCQVCRTDYNMKEHPKCPGNHGRKTESAGSVAEPAVISPR